MMGGMATKLRTLKRRPAISWYVGLGLLGQLIWGSYPPMAKRALMEVPKFSLLLFATAATTLVGLGVMWREEQRSAREVVAFLWHEKALWALAFFVVLRSVTNISAISLTRATWVQLVYLMTPFMVALLGVGFFGEPAPRYTYEALALSTLGAVLTLVTDWSDVLAGFSTRDFVGLGVAGLSMLSLAVYFQVVRRSSRQNAGRGLIMFQQGLAMTVTYAVISVFAGEDWGAWLHVSWEGWLVIAWVVGGIFALGNFVQITALSGANAALITSMMPLRLVSAIALGWWLLGERLTTPLQWLGAFLVLATVSGYLWLQRQG